MADNHQANHDRADLYEPYWYMSYPRWGIFGYAHPYAEILVYGPGMAFGLFMGGWSIIRAFTDTPVALIPGAVALFGIAGIGGFGLLQGIIRTIWLHRYIKATGVKPVLGDPANKPPGYDDRGWFARSFLP